MIARIAGLAALGAILATCSELWFWEVPDLSPLLILVYGCAGAAALILSERFPGRGGAGVVIAAGVFGFLIEGVMVPVLYETVPFSIMWTPLAWHALLSFGLGLVGFRVLMRDGRLWQVLLLLPLAGLFVGIWQGFLWTEYAPLAPGGARRFMIQSLVAAALFLVGHAALDLTGGRTGRATRAEVAILALLPAAVWGVTWAVPLFPVSLLLPCLLGLGVLALARGSPDRGDPLACVLATPLPPGRYPLFALFLVADIAGFYLAQGQGWPVNIWTVLIAGPLSVGLWLWAHWVCLRPRGVA